MNMGTFDFSELSAGQRALLAQGGWRTGGMGKIPRQGTVRKLLQRGLLVERVRMVFGVAVREYDMPEAARTAWLAHAASDGAIAELAHEAEH